VDNNQVQSSRRNSKEIESADLTVSERAVYLGSQGKEVQGLIAFIVRVDSFFFYSW
jgi:hypothetical protein